LLGALAVGIVVRLPQAPARAAAEHRAPRPTITIDPQTGMTFAPAPSSAAPALTAQQAWKRYARSAHSPRTTIPSWVTARLGLLTIPVGPADAPFTDKLRKSHGEAYSALNKLAYGYSSPSACLTLAPVVLPPNARCIEWTFVSASTGSMIVTTWQKIGHWHWPRLSWPS
jgi:hypothetical protein